MKSPFFKHRKRTISVILRSAALLALALVLLAGCSGTKTETEGETKPETQNTTPTGTEPETQSSTNTETQSEERDDTLVICVNESNYQVYAADFASFQAEHPELVIEYELIPVKEGEKRDTTLSRLRTELMAGQGADLFLLSASDGLFENIELNMKNGVFCDLLPLFEQAGMDMEDYLAPVMAAGQVDGKQYVVPIRYNLGLLLTNNVTKAAIGGENAQDTLSILSGLARLSETEGAGTRIASSFGNVQNPVTLASAFNPYYTSSPCVVDYANYTQSVASGYTSDVLEQMQKLLTNIDWVSHMRDKTTPEEWEEYIQSDKYFVYSTSLEYMLYEIGISNELGVTPNIDAVPAQKGEVRAMVERFAGIRANSRQKEAAAEFIKMLLSKERQSLNDHGAQLEGVWPVRKDCLAEIINGIVKKGNKPMSQNFSDTVFQDCLPEDVLNRFLELEASVTEARLAPPVEITNTINAFCDGKLDLKTAVSNMEEYWKSHLWDAN